MAYSETQLHAVIHTSSGEPAAGASVHVQLTATDIETDAGFVVPEAKAFTTDSKGEVSFGLWPNTEGYAGTQYQVTIRAANGATLANGYITVPETYGNAVLPLSSLWETDPDNPTSLTQRMLAEAEQYRTGARVARDAAQAAQQQVAEDASRVAADRQAVSKSATDAGNASTAASESAEASAHSATAASESANRAAADRASVATTITEVTGRVEQSQQLLDDTRTAQQRASEAASDAGISASSASESRNSAVAARDAAAASATQARSDAELGEEYRDQAASSANQASSSAQQAGDYLSSSQDAASAASTSAQQAGEYSQSAQQSAQASADAVSNKMAEFGVGDFIDVKRTSVVNPATLTEQNAQFWFIDDASVTPWPSEYVLISVSGAPGGVQLQEIMARDGQSLGERSTSQPDGFATSGSDWTVLLNNGVVPASNVPNLDASKVTTGVFNVNRLPSIDASKVTSGQFDPARIPDLSANKVTHGVFDVSRIPDLSPAKTGSDPAGTAADLLAGLGLNTTDVGVVDSLDLSVIQPSGYRCAVAVSNATGAPSGLDGSDVIYVVQETTLDTHGFQWVFSSTQGVFYRFQGESGSTGEWKHLPVDIGTELQPLVDTGIGSSKVDLTTAYDFDTVETAGTRRFIELSTATNGPVTNSSFAYLTALGQGDIPDQRGSVMVQTLDDEETFLRIRSAGGWGDWKKVTTPADIQAEFDALNLGKMAVDNISGGFDFDALRPTGFNTTVWLGGGVVNPPDFSWLTGNEWAYVTYPTTATWEEGLLQVIHFNNGRVVSRLRNEDNSGNVVWEAVHDSADRAYVDDSIADLLAQDDPYPQYMTQTETDTAIDTALSGLDTSGGSASVNMILNAGFSVETSSSDLRPYGWTTAGGGFSRGWDAAHGVHTAMLSPDGEAVTLSHTLSDAYALAGSTVRFGIDVAVESESVVVQGIGGRYFLSRAQVKPEGDRLTFDRAVAADAPEDLETLTLETIVTSETGWLQVPNDSTMPARWAHMLASDGDRYVYIYGGRGDDGFDLWNSTSAKDDFWRYDTQTDTLEELTLVDGGAGLPGPLCCGTMHYSDGKLYLFGGMVARQYYSGGDLESAHDKLVWIIDLATLECTRGADAPRPLFWHGSTLMDGVVYTAGTYSDDNNEGGTGIGNHPFVNAYDIAADSWSQLTDMPYSANSPSLTNVEGSIYLHGGFNNGAYFSDLYRGDISGTEVSWNALANAPISRTTFALFSDSDHGVFYAVGGNTPDGITNDVSVYQIANDSWTQLKNVDMTAVRFLAGARIGNQMILTGGWDGNAPTSQIWRLRTYAGIEDGAEVTPPAAGDSFPLPAPPVSMVGLHRPQLAPVSQYGEFTSGYPQNHTILKLQKQLDSLT